MIRQSFIFTAFVSLACANPVGAQQLLADAFGLYEDGSDAGRVNWAGLVSPLEEPDQGRTVRPGAADTMLIFFGNKSLAARTGTAQIAAVLFDQHGNLAPEGTSVALSAGDGTAAAITTNGIAARSVRAGDEVGRYFAWAEIMDGQNLRQSERVTYRLIPALSDLNVELAHDVADLSPETVVDLGFDTQAIGMASPVPDGVVTSLILTHEDGSFTQVPAVWINGQPNAPFLTRDISGQAEARMHFPFGPSAALDLNISAIEPGSPLEVRVENLSDLAALRVVLGPFTTRAGHILHDGSPVAVMLTDAEDHDFQAEGWTLEGMIELTFPTDALPASLTVSSPRGIEQVSLPQQEGRN